VGEVRGSDYLIKRTGFALITVFVAITINFFLFRVLPGDAVSNLARIPTATPELRHALRVQFGLDKSVWEQYWLYLGQLSRGNLGISFANQQPVRDNLVTAFGNTVPMVAIGTVVAIVIGILTGVLSAVRRHTVADHLSTNLAIAFYAFPTQFLGMMLLILFAGVLPSAGMSDPFALGDVSFGSHLADLAKHMILPAATLALTLYGENTLIVRSAMLETLGEDHVLTARAKGLSRRAIIRKHALRNAMLPTVTMIGLSLGSIVSGAILIEVIFSWPGIGSALYQAVLQRDYPMLQGGFLVITVTVILLNFVADLAYFRLDPRITS
jgi:ABC-type dipeptide/oligopeptide/nickel transport system permease component